MFLCPARAASTRTLTPLCANPVMNVRRPLWLVILSSPASSYSCRKRSHKRKDTAVEAILEQLIEHGPGEIGEIFSHAFELAMQIERERFLGAEFY